MEEKKIIELVIKHKIEYEKGIIDYMKNLLFRLLKIVIILLIIWFIINRYNPTFSGIF